MLKTQIKNGIEVVIPYRANVITNRAAIRPDSAKYSGKTSSASSNGQFSSLARRQRRMTLGIPQSLKGIWSL
jgi:transposase InsO family protein